MVNTGDTAWILTSAALVLLMTPGLALFYGGMVRAKSVLNMMMMSFGALALISVLWVIYGYSVAFGNDVGAGLLGNPGEFFGLAGLMEDTTSEEGGLPAMAFVGFQAVFAIITVALISGAIADRAKFGSWMVFAGVWATVVYFPVAHWVFDFSLEEHVGGWIANNLAAIDFAGGTAVHINAGAAGLALALVLGKRRGFGRDAMRPHNLPLVMIGAGLLWFGWFGFNAGSALAANNTASVVWVNTLVATAAATLAWLLVEKVRDGHSTSLGAASGVVAGLVAITPACSAVSPIGAIVVGAVAGVLCALAVGPEVPLRLRRLARRRRRAPRRRSRRHDHHRLPRHGRRPRGRRRSLLRRRGGPAVAAGRRCARRPGLLVRPYAGHRDRDPEDHRLPDHRGGRGHRHRQRRARGVGLRLRLPRRSSGSTAPLAGQARAEARSTEGVGA